MMTQPILEAPTVTPPLGRAARRALAAAFVFQVLLLVVVGCIGRFLMDGDGVAYLRIASYYRSGRWELAVCDYWGPLLSWLALPFLGLVEVPTDAMRIAMGLSAVVFLFGGVAVLRAMRLPPVAVVLGAWILAVASVLWSIGSMSPDLLASGLLCLAISRMLNTQWVETRSAPVVAGVLCGLAYLAKAVAFPVTFLLVAAFGVMWRFFSPRVSPSQPDPAPPEGVESVNGRTRSPLRACLLTLLGFSVVAAPWVAILSAKHGRFVFSTSGKVNHAIKGPEDRPREHPVVTTYHRPAPGRVTAWEDPASMPYAYWSPFESGDYFLHQLWLVAQNAVTLLQQLLALDRVGLGIVVVLLGFVAHRPWRENLCRDRWRWALVPVGCLTMLYLPVYAGDERYYFVVLPFVVGACLGMADWLCRDLPANVRWPRVAAYALVTLTFLWRQGVERLPLLVEAGGAPGRDAYELAERLHSAGIAGPVAGVGESRDPDRRGAGDPVDSLFVAYFLDQPWYGQKRDPTLDDILASGAELLVVPRPPLGQTGQREPTLVSRLDGASDRFENLDRRLFGSDVAAARARFKVYRIRRQ